MLAHVISDCANRVQETVSSTQSLSSSMVDYRRENGRTYHRYKDGSELPLNNRRINPIITSLEYNLPNDELEAERLGTQNM